MTIFQQFTKTEMFKNCVMGKFFVCLLEMYMWNILFIIKSNIPVKMKLLWNYIYMEISVKNTSFPHFSNWKIFVFVVNKQNVIYNIVYYSTDNKIKSMWNSRYFKKWLKNRSCLLEFQLKCVKIQIFPNNSWIKQEKSISFPIICTLWHNAQIIFIIHKLFKNP